VYARHNAVDVDARLPDGRGSPLSVSTVLHKQPVRVPKIGENGDA
jgi:NADH-quinone oxidoreductase subunit J